MSHRTRQIGYLAALIVGICVVTWIASEIVPRSRYGYTSRRITEKIRSLRDRKPADVDAALWNECVDWAVSAHGNTCFSEEHTSYAEMHRFETELDEQLKRDVGPNTLRWVFDRLEATGPAGKRYIAKFRDQWTDSLNAISNEPRS
jgi:hypothetical protein